MLLALLTAGAVTLELHFRNWRWSQAQLASELRTAQAELSPPS